MTAGTPASSSPRSWTVYYRGSTHAVVWRCALLLVLEVERVDVEGVDQPGGVLEPHGGAVEVDQHPLVRVEVERVCFVDAAHQRSELGTDEGRACVGGVHVQPDALLLADDADLVQSVERAAVRRAERRHRLRTTKGSEEWTIRRAHLGLTKKGVSPASRSFLMAASRASPRNLNSPSAGTVRSVTPPKRPARSTEECA